MLTLKKQANVLFWCFVLSGAAALIYEVAWTKALGLIFGHTVYALAIVLAVFMAGLALGSAYFAPRPKENANPLSRYVKLELLAGLTGGISLFALEGVRRFYIEIYPAVTGFQPALLVVRLIGATAVLFIPTFLIGGTLPTLVHTLTNDPQELGVRFNRLYQANTLGAVAGTLISGFVLLPFLGLRLTVTLAALINIIAGLAAWWLGSSKDYRAPEVHSLGPGPSAYNPVPIRPGVLFLVFGIVGSTAFAFELAWTRLLAIVVGSSIYAFTIMLGTFLTGTVIGTVAFHRLRTRISQFSVSSLAGSQLFIGATTLLSLFFFNRTVELIPSLIRLAHETFAGLALAQLVTGAATIFPAAVAFGFNFPLVVLLIYRSAGQRPKTVGQAYAANTIGGIVGSLIAGFWLIRLLGSYRLLAAMAAVNILLSLALYLSVRPRLRVTLAFPTLALACAAVIGWLPSFYNRPSLLMSAVLYGSSPRGNLNLDEIAAKQDLVYAEDGLNSSVVVQRTDDSFLLRINGKVDASTGDAPTQLMLAHLGAAFHPAPRRVLVIGFGSGMTVHAISLYPDVQKIDCVEIEPAVIRAAPHLESLNHNILRDRRVHIIFDDARNFLLTSTEQYDLIISEPSNPWIAGVATLFTDEFYTAARQRLAPGGEFVQWLQAYSLEPGDVRMVLATLSPHFPDVTLWRGEEPDLLILGRTDPKPLEFEQLRRWWQIPAIRKQFEIVDLHGAEGVVAYYLLDDPAIRALTKGAKINTDDRTLLEYSAPRALLKSDLTDANYAMLRQFRTGPLPRNLDPLETGSALTQGLATAFDLADTRNARDLIAALESGPPSATFYIDRGRLALAEDKPSDAQSFLKAALKLDPASLEAMRWLAAAERRLGWMDAAEARLEKILELDPAFLPALEDQLVLSIDRSDFRKAATIQLRRLSILPDTPAYEYCRLGGVWMKLSSFYLAELVLVKGLAKDPYSYACHLELGDLYRKTGRFPLARRSYEWVVRFFPDADSSLFRNLAGVDLVLRDPHAAAAAIRKGLRIFPHDPELERARSLVGE